MTTLITGGGSLTGLALAHLLQDSGRKVIFTSRSGDRIPSEFGPSIKLDWSDSSTISELWASSVASAIEFVYLLALPQTLGDNEAGNTNLANIKTFIDLAAEKGAKRFIVLSGSNPGSERGPQAQGTGKLHTYLHDKGLDYVTLRPTFFTENLIRIYGKGIKDSNTIQTSIPTGRVPFIAVQDIAQVAFDAIVNVDSLSTREPTLIGPDLLSYSQVAELLSEVLGRSITHKIISPSELTQQFITIGYPEGHANFLVALEQRVEAGSEDHYEEDQRTVVGKIGVKEWIEEHKAAFI